MLLFEVAERLFGGCELRACFFLNTRDDCFECGDDLPQITLEGGVDPRPN